ncbi:MAG: EF-P lysine aminoacylase EpmA [Hyphomicrobiaceae bacterium]|nr:EF-P lysine aminoacylase EpmA [Hyphomicrobiaceae bacterium]
MSNAAAWWSPSAHADRRPLLLARATIRDRIRRLFASRRFIEVETGSLAISPGNETHLHAFPTTAIGTDLAARQVYLRTSPEFAMKKLLAAGEPRIFEFAASFRNRERGPLHAPEFTMLEWYRAGSQGYGTPIEDPFQHMIEDAAAVVYAAADALGTATMRFRDRAVRLDHYRQMTVAEAFARHLDLRDDLARRLIEAPHREELASVARDRGHRIGEDETCSSLFSRLMADIEPALGIGTLLILTDYPIGECALAKPHRSNPAVGQRFEVYACGVELANGFAELDDGPVQRRNLEAQMAERARIYGDTYPIDEEFIAAVGHLRDATGCAMGFDRLVMLLTGAPSVEAVRWTPFPA